MFAVLGCGAGAAHAQSPPEPEIRCGRTSPARDCVDATLAVRFENGSSLLLDAPTRFDVEIVLRSEAAGIEAWSYGVAHDPSLLGLVEGSLTTRATASWIEGRAPDFDVTRAVGDDLAAGFVSAVLLSHAGGVFLPAGGERVLATASYELRRELPALGAALRFEDLTAGSPSAVELVVDGEPRRVRRLEHGLVGECDPRLRETFCADRPECTEDRLELRFDAKDGPSLREARVGDEIHLVPVLDTSSRSIVDGWSYAVSHDPAVLELVSASLDGTDAHDALSAPHFNVTRPVDGDADHPPGFISAVVLCFLHPASLIPSRRNSLARAVYRVVGEPPPEGTRLRFENDRVRHAPSPTVWINLTIEGNARLPDVLEHALLCGARPPRFQRGDADASGRVDLSDALAVIDLVRGARAAGGSCLDAFDVDDNGRVDLIDATFLLRYLFAGGRSLPVPNDCGVDFTEDALRCEAVECNGGRS